ncbi:MAG: DHA2 family efflux MFS transporter permease subunit [Gaiellales bacterium]|nr:MAG: DHA2 family efflux MFS transporter permease subunit [Gaiellales bacterium]
METQDSPGGAVGTQTDRHSWMVLGSVSSGLLLYALTSTTLGVALPTITADFGASFTTIAWVSVIFFMVHSTLMPVMGRAGDLYGRKRLFIFGLSLFTIMSLFCALAWNVESLIAGRAVMAVGTAALPPMALAYAYSAFPPERKALAVGIMGGILGVAPVAGYLLGGVLVDAGNLVDFIGWRAIFLINFPLAAVIIPFALRALKETEPSPEGRDFDVPGAALLVAGLVCLALGVNKGGEWGWTSPRILGVFIAAPALLLLFVLREGSCRRPLVSLGLFRYRSLTTANIAGFFITGGLFGSMLVLPFYFASVLELSSTWIGLAAAPVAVTYAMFAPVGGSLTARFGGRVTLIGGLLISAAGYLLVSRALSVPPGAEFILGAGGAIEAKYFAALIVAAAVGLVGVGIGLCWAPVDNTALYDVPAHKRGLAASLPNMSRFIGGSIASAGLMAFLSWRMTERLIGIGIPVAEAEAFTGTSMEPLSPVYKQAAAQAYHDVFLFTLIFIAAAILAALAMPQVKTGRKDQ